MFSKPAINRRPEALAEFRLALDRIVVEARHWQLDRRTLADHLEGQAQALRTADAISRPVV